LCSINKSRGGGRGRGPGPPPPPPPEPGSSRGATGSAERSDHLYRPQTAYRLRRDNWPDTPLPPEFPAGRNPPDGAIIDYYLAADASGPVTLEIRSGRTLVRRYSSDDKPQPLDEKAFNVPMHWARAPRALSAAAGMHRFLWDLRYPPPNAVQRDFPISAVEGDTPLEPLGVLALPGAYTVTLSAGGRTYTQPLMLKMDPRATITPLGLTQQFTLATKIAGMMNRTFDAISAPRNSANRANPENLENHENLEHPENHDSLITLNTDLATAYDVVEGGDRAPTTQAVKAAAHLEQRLRALLK
jgi:hypothetical protein